MRHCATKETNGQRAAHAHRASPPLSGSVMWQASYSGFRSVSVQLWTGDELNGRQRVLRRTRLHLSGIASVCFLLSDLRSGELTSLRSQEHVEPVRAVGRRTDGAHLRDRARRLDCSGCCRRCNDPGPRQGRSQLRSASRSNRKPGCCIRAAGTRAEAIEQDIVPAERDDVNITVPGNRDSREVACSRDGGGGGPRRAVVLRTGNRSGYKSRSDLPTTGGSS